MNSQVCAAPPVRVSVPDSMGAATGHRAEGRDPCRDLTAIHVVDRAANALNLGLVLVYFPVKKWPLSDLFLRDRAAGSVSDRFISSVSLCGGPRMGEGRDVIRLSAMTPKPTQRCMPSSPW